MSGKRRHQAQQYGMRRQTKAYQITMMKEQQDKQKNKEKKMKVQRRILMGVVIAFAILTAAMILLQYLIPSIICGVIFVGVAVYFILWGRKMQKESIIEMKEMGYTKRMLMQQLERRGEKQSTIDAYEKMWDKYNAPKKAAK